MTYTFTGKQLGSTLNLSTDYANDKNQLLEENLISIHWNRGNQDYHFLIDGIEYILKPNQLTTSTYLHKLTFVKGQEPLTTFSFNREFYCIQDHDHEVSCNGILFFGTSENPIITLDETEQPKFEMLFHVFEDEFKTKDPIQGEMLNMLLKRLIIKTTRLAKEQLIPKELDDTQIDTVRKYNVLVDLNYRQKHQVSDYAELLFKSPKTLSNLFAKYNQKSPLQIIHDRIALEGKRLLLFTDKTVKEIAYDLGFEDAGVFHKLFKKRIGQTPNEFKTHMKEQPST